MKTILTTIFCLMISMAAFSQSVEINKDNCTITKNGKTYKLYGKVQIVEHFGDIKVQFVNSFGDIKVKFVEYFADDCGEWKIVNSFPDLKIEIVTSFPDIKVETVESFPGMRK